MLDCARALQRAAGAPAVGAEQLSAAVEAVGKARGGSGAGGEAGGDGNNLTKEELEETMKKMLAVRGQEKEVQTRERG